MEVESPEHIIVCCMFIILSATFFFSFLFQSTPVLLSFLFFQIFLFKLYSRSHQAFYVKMNSIEDVDVRLFSLNLFAGKARMRVCTRANFFKTS